MQPELIEAMRVESIEDAIILNRQAFFRQFIKKAIQPSLLKKVLGKGGEEIGIKSLSENEVMRALVWLEYFAIKNTFNKEGIHYEEGNIKVGKQDADKYLSAIFSTAGQDKILIQEAFKEYYELQENAQDQIFSVGKSALVFGRGINHDDVKDIHDLAVIGFYGSLLPSLLNFAMLLIWSRNERKDKAQF